MTKSDPNVRSLAWNPYATIEPKYDQETRADHPTLKTLTLAVSECETFAHFDPAISTDDRNDEEGSLLNAVAEVARNMIEAAVEEEARYWVEEHDTIWVVTGFTGYSDSHQEWNVKAFLDQDRARMFTDELNAFCKEKGLDIGGANVGSVVDPHGAIVHCPDDPHFRVEGGTAYRIKPVPLDLTPEPFHGDD